MSARKLLVNADDLGLSSAINTGIVSAHLHGIVTSTSIVAAGQAFEQAARLALVHSTLGVGVHLTLVEENSVCPPATIPTLAPHGVLPRTYGELVTQVLAGRIHLLDIEREFRAQIEKCLLAGIKPTHLDSHQHTHALPLIFPIAIRLANEYKIPGIRIPRCFPAIRHISSARFVSKCALCLFAYADAAVFPLGQCITTSRFTGLFESGALTEPQLLQILEELSTGTTELVCHPGIHDPSTRYANWNQRRQIELASLTGAAAKERVAQLGIELIGYRGL